MVLNSAGISYEYSGNCKYPVADYVISSTGRLERKGVFPANSLKCNTVWDEDKNKVETFTDNIGRVILTRRYDSSKAYDTYNVYDSRNRLCYIFPPMASDALITNREYAMEKGGVLDLYAYYYQYDSYNRCVEKNFLVWNLFIMYTIKPIVSSCHRAETKGRRSNGCFINMILGDERLSWESLQRIKPYRF